MKSKNQHTKQHRAKNILAFVCGLALTGFIACASDSSDENPTTTLAPIVMVNAGSKHTCAITKLGALYCWGNNTNGQLGLGNNTEQRSPQPLAAPLNNGVSQVALGNNHTCAIKHGGLYCWGNHADGRLGLGDTVSQTWFPQALPAPLNSDVTHVSATRNRTCAIKLGTLYCWGENSDGQLILGHFNDQKTPQALSTPLDRDVTHINVARRHHCAIKNGALYCWGNDRNGQLGLRNTNLTTMSPEAISSPLDSDVSQIALGRNHTCAKKSGGTLYCWGSGLNGQLGLGNVLQQSSPQGLPAPFNSDVSHISAQNSHTCALKDGSLYCWGNNGDGQLGLKNLDTPKLSPQLITAFDSGVTQVKLGNLHTCAIQNENLYCWGNNANGRLGLGNTIQQSSPQLVPIKW